jgi:hypothetical protein
MLGTTSVLTRGRTKVCDWDAYLKVAAILDNGGPLFQSACSVS